ncbi:MAG: hypothetical protein R3A79_00645 [Nannocystaceae bacterium]
MRALQLGALALVSFGLVGYAVFSMVTSEPVRPRGRAAASSAGAARPAARTPAARDAKAPIVRFARAARSVDAPPTLDAEPPADDDEAAAFAAAVAEEAPVVDARPIPRAVAEAAFESLISELEELEPEALGAVERERLYRNVSDAFTTLSIQLGENETAALEDAYTRMHDEMRRLRLQRPKYDPSAERRR